MRQLKDFLLYSECACKLHVHYPVVMMYSLCQLYPCIQLSHSIPIGSAITSHRSRRPCAQAANIIWWQPLDTPPSLFPDPGSHTFLPSISTLLEKLCTSTFNRMRHSTRFFLDIRMPLLHYVLILHTTVVVLVICHSLLTRYFLVIMPPIASGGFDCSLPPLPSKNQIALALAVVRSKPGGMQVRGN